MVGSGERGQGVILGATHVPLSSIIYRVLDGAKKGTEIMPNTGTNGTSRRGFAAMDAEKQRAIASKGGRAAHESGRAHEFTTDEARMAGRKGGQTVSRDRLHMAEIGRKGGEARSSSDAPSTSPGRGGSREQKAEAGRKGGSR